MNGAIQVSIRGISPLLMHAFPLRPIEALEKKPPEEQAELAAYRDPDTGELYIPAINIQRCLVSAAAYSKGRGRSTLQKPVAACVFVDPERVLLGTKEYSIDARAVVVPATRGRVVRYRPRLDNWECSFSLTYDPTLLTEAQLRKVVDDAGNWVGLLDFRPEKKGPFGRFMVVEWRKE